MVTKGTGVRGTDPGFKAKGYAWAAATIAALSLSCFAPMSAGAQTFGTDLSQPINVPISCSEGVLNQFLLQFLYGPFGDTCTWTSVTTGNASDSLTAPGTGTVTAVRVKMGATTGPMQVVVIRYIFQQTGNPGSPNIACCFVQEYGPVFTPAANAITTVPTNLPVVVQPTPPPNDLTDTAATDQLALTSLDPSVQVPLFATNGGSNDLSVLSYAWYPAPTSGTVPAPSYNPIGGFADLSGLKVLMNADFTPAGSGGGGITPPPTPPVIPPPGVAPPALPLISLPKLTIPVNRNTAIIPIQCLVTNCNGTLTLQNAQQAGLARTASSKPKIISYGTVRFSLKAGTTGKLKIRLNAAGRKILSKHKRVKIWANVHFFSGGGAPKSIQLTLKG